MHVFCDYNLPMFFLYFLEIILIFAVLDSVTLTLVCKLASFYH